ncbi:ATP-binding protein [Terrabacter aerolatus]|uniref:Histidine kinase n=1 Tax=Terrabacter aerolatus TaxID=422442 RepID=A0A512D043_9MICO|nr:ATP-binding protein [Terrabacter aerolatus]GEO29831.1 histidine kinase [Terrabacter aerolatus]
MQTAYENGTGPARPPGSTWRTTPRPPLVRQRQGKVIAGVAAGLAAHLGIPVVAVRVALVLTSIPFGAGLAVYVFLWATMRDVGSVDPAAVTPPSATTPATAGPAGPTGPTGATGASSTPPAATTTRHPIDLAALRTWLRSGNQAVLITLLGVAALAVAGALWLGSAGLDVHVEVILPVVAIVIGAIFFWSQLDDTDTLGARRPVRWIWLVVGLGLTILGLVGLLVRGTNLTELWQVAGAVLAALVGVAVLSAPWILRLWSNLRVEQAARIRATERADIAAHLHDSVLQTLALIQRQSGDAAAVARLARAQERQLRSYLYDEGARAGTLGAALTAAMGEVEDLHGVPVQLVVTGDRPMDEHLDALVKAVREATWNAVRHASPPVSTYVEVGPVAVEAFVRDHGAGFDLDTVPDDRAGVRESIIGRMERHGGTARIRRRADGTEVELRLPVSQPHEPEHPSPSAATAPDPPVPSSATPPSGTTSGSTPDPQTQEQAS